MMYLEDLLPYTTKDQELQIFNKQGEKLCDENGLIPFEYIGSVVERIYVDKGTCKLIIVAENLEEL